MGIYEDILNQLGLSNVPLLIGDPADRYYQELKKTSTEKYLPVLKQETKKQKEVKPKFEPKDLTEEIATSLRSKIFPPASEEIAVAGPPSLMPKTKFHLRDVFNLYPYPKKYYPPFPQEELRWWEVLQGRKDPILNQEEIKRGLDLYQFQTENQGKFTEAEKPKEYKSTEDIKKGIASGDIIVQPNDLVDRVIYSRDPETGEVKKQKVKIPVSFYVYRLLPREIEGKKYLVPEIKPSYYIDSKGQIKPVERGLIHKALSSILGDETTEKIAEFLEEVPYSVTYPDLGPSPRQPDLPPYIPTDPVSALIGIRQNLPWSKETEAEPGGKPVEWGKYPIYTQTQPNQQLINLSPYTFTGYGIGNVVTSLAQAPTRLLGGIPQLPPLTVKTGLEPTQEEVNLLEQKSKSDQLKSLIFNTTLFALAGANRLGSALITGDFALQPYVTEPERNNWHHLAEGLFNVVLLNSMHWVSKAPRSIKAGQPVTTSTLLTDMLKRAGLFTLAESTRPVIFHPDMVVENLREQATEMAYTLGSVLFLEFFGIKNWGKIKEFNKITEAAKKIKEANPELDKIVKEVSVDLEKPPTPETKQEKPKEEPQPIEQPTQPVVEETPPPSPETITSTAESLTTETKFKGADALADGLTKLAEVIKAETEKFKNIGESAKKFTSAIQTVDKEVAEAIKEQTQQTLEKVPLPETERGKTVAEKVIESQIQEKIPVPEKEIAIPGEKPSEEITPELPIQEEVPVPEEKSIEQQTIKEEPTPTELPETNQIPLETQTTTEELQKPEESTQPLEQTRVTEEQTPEEVGLPIEEPPQGEPVQVTTPPASPVTKFVENTEIQREITNIYPTVKGSGDKMVKTAWQNIKSLFGLRDKDAEFYKPIIHSFIEEEFKKETGNLSLPLTNTFKIRDQLKKWVIDFIENNPGAKDATWVDLLEDIKAPLYRATERLNLRTFDFDKHSKYIKDLIQEYKGLKPLENYSKDYLQRYGGPNYQKYIPPKTKNPPESELTSQAGLEQEVKPSEPLPGAGIPPQEVRVTLPQMPQKPKRGRPKKETQEVIQPQTEIPVEEKPVVEPQTITVPQPIKEEVTEKPQIKKTTKGKVTKEEVLTKNIPAEATQEQPTEVKIERTKKTKPTKETIKPSVEIPVEEKPKEEKEVVLPEAAIEKIGKKKETTYPETEEEKPLSPGEIINLLPDKYKPIAERIAALNPDNFPASNKEVWDEFPREKKELLTDVVKNKILHYLSLVAELENQGRIHKGNISEFFSTRFKTDRIFDEIRDEVGTRNIGIPLDQGLMGLIKQTGNELKEIISKTSPVKNISKPKEAPVTAEFKQKIKQIEDFISHPSYEKYKELTEMLQNPSWIPQGNPLGYGTTSKLWSAGRKYFMKDLKDFVQVFTHSSQADINIANFVDKYFKGKMMEIFPLQDPLKNMLATMNEGAINELKQRFAQFLRNIIDQPPEVKKQIFDKDFPGEVFLQIQWLFPDKDLVGLLSGSKTLKDQDIKQIGRELLAIRKTNEEKAQQISPNFEKTIKRFLEPAIKEKIQELATSFAIGGGKYEEFQNELKTYLKNSLFGSNYIKAFLNPKELHKAWEEAMKINEFTPPESEAKDLDKELKEIKDQLNTLYSFGPTALIAPGLGAYLIGASLPDEQKDTKNFLLTIGISLMMAGIGYRLWKNFHSMHRYLTFDKQANRIPGSVASSPGFISQTLPIDQIKAFQKQARQFKHRSILVQENPLAKKLTKRFLEIERENGKKFYKVKEYLNNQIFSLPDNELATISRTAIQTERDLYLLRIKAKSNPELKGILKDPEQLREYKDNLIKKYLRHFSELFGVKKPFEDLLNDYSNYRELIKQASILETEEKLAGEFGIIPEDFKTKEKYLELTKQFEEKIEQAKKQFDDLIKQTRDLRSQLEKSFSERIKEYKKDVKRTINEIKTDVRINLKTLKNSLGPAFDKIKSSVSSIYKEISQDASYSEIKHLIKLINKNLKDIQTNKEEITELTLSNLWRGLVKLEQMLSETPHDTLKAAGEKIKNILNQHNPFGLMTKEYQNIEKIVEKISKHAGKISFPDPAILYLIQDLPKTLRQLSRWYLSTNSIALAETNLEKLRNQIVDLVKKVGAKTEQSTQLTIKGELEKLNKAISDLQAKLKIEIGEKAKDLMANQLTNKEYRQHLAKIKELHKMTLDLKTKKVQHLKAIKEVYKPWREASKLMSPDNIERILHQTEDVIHWNPLWERTFGEYGVKVQSVEMTPEGKLQSWKTHTESPMKLVVYEHTPETALETALKFIEEAGYVPHEHYENFFVNPQTKDVARLVTFNKKELDVMKNRYKTMMTNLMRIFGPLKESVRAALAQKKKEIVLPTEDAEWLGTFKNYVKQLGNLPEGSIEEAEILSKIASILPERPSDPIDVQKFLEILKTSSARITNKIFRDFIGYSVSDDPKKEARYFRIGLTRYLSGLEKKSAKSKIIASLKSEFIPEAINNGADYTPYGHFLTNLLDNLLSAPTTLLEAGMIRAGNKIFDYQKFLNQTKTTLNFLVFFGNIGAAFKNIMYAAIINPANRIFEGAPVPKVLKELTKTPISVFDYAKLIAKNFQHAKQHETPKIYKDPEKQWIFEQLWESGLLTTSVLDWIGGYGKNIKSLDIVLAPTSKTEKVDVIAYKLGMLLQSQSEILNKLISFETQYNLLKGRGLSKEEKLDAIAAGIARDVGFYSPWFLGSTTAKLKSHPIGSLFVHLLAPAFVQSWRYVEMAAPTIKWRSDSGNAKKAVAALFALSMTTLLLGGFEGFMGIGDIMSALEKLYLKTHKGKRMFDMNLLEKIENKVIQLGEQVGFSRETMLKALLVAKKGATSYLTGRDVHIDNLLGGYLRPFIEDFTQRTFNTVTKSVSNPEYLVRSLIPIGVERFVRYIKNITENELLLKGKHTEVGSGRKLTVKDWLFGLLGEPLYDVVARKLKLREQFNFDLASDRYEFYRKALNKVVRGRGKKSITDDYLMMAKERDNTFSSALELYLRASRIFLNDLSNGQSDCLDNVYDIFKDNKKEIVKQIQKLQRYVPEYGKPEGFDRFITEVSNAVKDYYETVALERAFKVTPFYEFVEIDPLEEMDIGDKTFKDYPLEWQGLLYYLSKSTEARRFAEEPAYQKIVEIIINNLPEDIRNSIDVSSLLESYPLEESEIQEFYEPYEWEEENQ